MAGKILRRIVGAVAAAVLVLVGMVAVTPAVAAGTGVVTRSGSQLLLNGQPYSFVGTNAYSLTGCHSGKPDSQEVQDAYFSQLNANVVTRTWAFQHLPDAEAGIDRVIRTAEKYGTKLILTLQEGAEYCGAPDYDAAYYKSGYKSSLLPWVDKIVSKYKDSPAILAWEISNEPAWKAGGGLTLDDLKGFLDTVAARIKAADPTHLVASGTGAPYQGVVGNTAAGYAKLHSGANIDMVSLHEYDYPYNNGQGSSAIISPHWAKTIEAADMVDKPAYVGEMGMSLKSGTMSAQQRADVTVQKARAYKDKGAAGSIYWVALSDTNAKARVQGDVTNSEYGARDGLTSPVVKAIAALARELAPATPDPVPTATPTMSPTAGDVLGAGEYDQTALTYTGAWSTSQGDGKRGGTDTHSSAAGASATVRFSGTSVDLVGTLDKHHGTATITLDGQAAEVTFKSDTRQTQQVVYTADVAAGEHTLTVTVRGDGVVALDALTIHNDPPPEPTPEPTVEPTPEPTPEPDQILVDRAWLQALRDQLDALLTQ